MAKGHDVVPSDSRGSDDALGTLRGVLTLCVIAGVGVYMSYSAGSKVSDRVLRQVNKERRKNEKDKRRDLKERKKEAKAKLKLDMIKAKYNRQ